MDLFTEKFGFESGDIDTVTEELARALDMKPDLRFYEGYGGDYTSFRDPDRPGAHMSLYLNNHMEVDGPTTHEEDHPELGLILLIEQEGDYVDYEPKLRRMEKFAPILIHRRRRLESKGKKEVLFDLAKDRSKPKP